MAIVRTPLLSIIMVKDADNVALLVIHDITHVHDGGAGHIYFRVRGKGAYQC